MPTQLMAAWEEPIVLGVVVAQPERELLARPEA